MKKRKKPILLLAVIFLLVGAVAAMNTSLLTMPKTAEDYQRQAELEAAKNDPQPTKTADKSKAKSDAGSLVNRTEEGDDEPMATNIKPVPAINPDGPKIAAPRDIKNRIKAPDKASTQPSSGWYYPNSGANGH